MLIKLLQQYALHSYHSLCLEALTAVRLSLGKASSRPFASCVLHSYVVQQLSSGSEGWERYKRIGTPQCRGLLPA